MGKAIEVKNLSHRFGTQHVLDDVCLSIERGQIVGLTGNNGSGKSVLLKCICGLIKPSTGSVTVSGLRVGKDVDFPQNMGAVIEYPGFLPFKSGSANMKYLWMLRKKVPASNIDMAMVRVGLDPGSRKSVGKYSMGMRQRLALAQALFENPDILILDEPFSGLDKAGSAEMRQLMRQLGEEGKAILIASHNPLDLNPLCDVIYEINCGKMGRLQ